MWQDFLFSAISAGISRRKKTMGNPKPRQDAEHAAGRRAINAGFTDFYVRTYWTGFENIGLIANYRAQFDHIIRTSSYQDLVRRLQNAREE